MKTQTVYTPAEAVITPGKAVAGIQPRAATRILFVDNLRIYLTILVILHHLIIIYSGSGSWNYTEGRQDEITGALASWFASVNHSYFMGLFLLVAAYFVPGSYDRKGAARFLKDRLIRLGIPLVVYSWILRPLWIYAKLSIYEGLNISFIEWCFREYFKDNGLIGGGPLWFISALLLFSVIYAILRLLIPSRPTRPAADTAFPRDAAIVVFASAIALASFVVRLWFPSDKTFGLLNYQLADFPGYIALFTLGLVAYRRGWLLNMPDVVGRRWLWIAVFLILAFPPIAIFGGAMTDVTPFKGGWHWQALLAALWQSFLCVSMCISLVYIFRLYLDRQGSLAGFFSRNAYTAYLIHEPVITFAALAAAGLMLYPLLKFGLMALLTIPLIFWLSSMVRKLPYSDRIL